MDYPIWNVAMGGGLLMAIVAIAHVIVAHFAVGGGLVLVVTETLAVRRGDRELRELARRSSLILVLVSTVFGAISGVGIWFVAGLISPAAISALIHTYVWGWAIEWTFFVVEIVAALIYYTTWDRISKSAHLLVGWLYFVSAYLSLVVINGIITFMLTPGRWLETGAFWDGFFNPTYWPSLMLRTGICAVMATVFLVFAAQRADPGARPRLVRYLGWWLVAGGLVAYGGYRWWEASLPESVVALFRGTSPTLETLAFTRSVMMWALAALLLLGGALLVALPKAGRTPAAVAIMIAAFVFFGGYERLREGVRKPFIIHSFMFSNGLKIADIGKTNSEGTAATSGWIAVHADGGAEGMGQAIFGAQCASCHTLDGYQGIRSLLPSTSDMLAVVSEPPRSGRRAYQRQCASCHPDVEYDDMKQVLPTADEIRSDPGFIHELNLGMIAATLSELREMGSRYLEAERTQVFDTRKTSHPAMPPLVGNDRDLEALAAYLGSLVASEKPRDTVARVGGE